MKLVGITMVRNEADIVGLTIRHHLRIGCDAILAVDNASTDRTSAVLERLARRDERVRWASDPGSYRQSEITTGLAHQAAALGADWVMPFDADEFWWSRGPVKAVLDRARDAAALLAPVVNFVQHRRRTRSSRRALLSMRMRAIPVPPVDDSIRMVTEREIGFVEIVYPHKSVFRADPDIVVATGNHEVANASGPIVPTTELACLHAPLRSKRALEAQVEHGRRIAELSSDPRTVWHARRWHQLWESGDFAGEWPANSYRGGALDVYGQRHPVERDGRLRAAARAVLVRHPFA
jgi:Glycosyl transferase family 2